MANPNTFNYAQVFMGSIGRIDVELTPCQTLSYHYGCLCVLSRRPGEQPGRSTSKRHENDELQCSRVAARRDQTQLSVIYMKRVPDNQDRDLGEGRALPDLSSHHT